MSRKFDFVVFGATGYTGEWLVEKLIWLQNNGKYPRKFTWAVAGRSKARLTKSLEKISKITGEDLSKIEKIEADVQDDDSLRLMASQCTVLLSVVGPYLVHGGESVVNACVVEGTNYVDLTGEGPFVCDMILKYDAEAKRQHIFIVNSVGFDSIPADLGVVALADSFKGGELNEATCIVDLSASRGEMKGAIVNFGTYHSIILIMGRLREAAALMKEVFTERMPKPKFRMASLGWLPVFYDEEMKKWCMATDTADGLHVRRTQQFLYKTEGRRPVQFRQAYAFPSLTFVVVLMFLGFWWMILAQNRFTMKLLEKFPRFFTLGIFSKEGPSRETVENSITKFIIRGKGWNEKKFGTSHDHDQPPSSTKRVTITCKNPGYGATCLMMAESALSILFEKDKMPASGGVMSPGAAFAKTDIVKRLNADGVTFDFEQEDSKKK